jgi:hypothetical protein
MRVLAPTPESNVSTEVGDGYQLCARCGEALVTGENALAAPRLYSWLVCTHQIGPGCPPKSVRGWKAVRFADTVREHPNKEVHREGEPYNIGGARRACVCLIDDRHLEAELALVVYRRAVCRIRGSVSRVTWKDQLQFRHGMQLSTIRQARPYSSNEPSQAIARTYRKPR